ncbi:BtrH N-terminal domain-containing protein [Mucilaginibacter ximonensis]|uniref:BtrH N-terminal domain-containing protein n=1 Tax=Mucilaginibacter ximonensis TaxID=538021 RepID=A0ABW5Y8U1_9SPHI
MKLDFNHIQAAHCENGVTVGLLKNSGVQQITEPLAFGIGSGLFFVYIPVLKINNGPVIAFRSMPGLIFKRTCKALNIPIVRKKFSSKEAAEKFLNERLSEGHPVGCQVGVYYLPYFPREYRFHFNAHNLIVFGAEDGNYMVSDPVMESTNVMSAYELERVRFAKGALAPNGQLYYPKENKPVTNEQIKAGIISGIKRNVFNMISPWMGPIAGVNGIKYTGNKIKQWRDKLGVKEAGSYLAQLVRMQEEIGTGGGGFRYIYGAFLQEAYSYIPNDELMEISKQFTASGDLWREGAIQAAGIYKGRLGSQQDFNKMGDYLLEIAEIERKAFVALKNVKWH